MNHDPIEWPWVADDAQAEVAAQPGADGGSDMGQEDLARLAARCFRGADGARLMIYLKNLTLNRALGPEAGDAVLRHVEGQRQLVQHISHLVDLGRGMPAITTEGNTQ